MMRSSEEMAHTMYVADWKAIHHEQSRDASFRSAHPLSWDELTEEEQTTYYRHVQTAFKYLFEHGRISSYLNEKQLAKFKEEYRAYLAGKRSITSPHP